MYHQHPSLPPCVPASANWHGLGRATATSHGACMNPPHPLVPPLICWLTPSSPVPSHATLCSVKASTSAWIILRMGATRQCNVPLLLLGKAETAMIQRQLNVAPLVVHG